MVDVSKWLLYLRFCGVFFFFLKKLLLLKLINLQKKIVKLK